MRIDKIIAIYNVVFVFSSKDSFVKWWDLDTQHCFKTLVGHRSEVSTASTTQSGPCGVISLLS